MHSPPAITAIPVTDGHSRFTYPDGKTEDVKRRDKSYAFRLSITYRKI